MHIRQMMEKSRRVLWIAITAAACAGLSAAQAGAQQLEKLDTSLQWVPENAAYYSAALRLGEQIDAVCKSRAWASLKAMPAVQAGLRKLKGQLSEGEHAAQVQSFLNNPEVQDALALLKDMISQEMFIYGDPDSVDCVELLQRIAGAMRYGPAMAQMTGQVNPSEMGKLQGKLLLTVLADNRELIKVPTTVIGFRLTNRDRAVQSLAKLEGLMGLLALAEPKINQYFKRQKVAGSDYLTVTLRGEEIPWDQIPLDQARELESRKGDVDKLVARAKKLTLVISLGLRKDYLLLSFAPSTEHLARLGNGPALAGRPELKPLAEYAGRRVAAVTYMSQPMAQRLMDSQRQVDDLLKTVRDLLSKTNLGEEQKAEIRKDADELSKDLKRLMPKRGAIMGFRFLTDRGIEGYTYQWGDLPHAEARPLGLLEHIGGRPILALVGRGRPSVESYDVVVKWVAKAHHYVEKYVVPQMNAEQRDEYKKAMGLLRPIGQRLNEVNRTLLIPSLADGQCGFVLDAKLTSRQFLKNLGETPKPMPMVEPAFVVGVSNAGEFENALKAYWEMANAAIDALRKLQPGKIPDDFKIPEPQTEKTDAGTFWWFTLPAEWGVTPEIAPTLGLSKEVAAFTITKDHARRLLAPTPLGFGDALAGKDRARAGAIAFDFAGLIDAVTPWAELGVRELIRQNPDALDVLAPEVKPQEQTESGKKGEETPKAKPEGKKKGKKPAKKAEIETRIQSASADVTLVAAKARKKPGAKPGAPKSKEEIVIDELHTVLNALKTLRAVTMEVTVQNGVRVSHLLTEIRDIE